MNYITVALLCSVSPFHSGRQKRKMEMSFHGYFPQGITTSITQSSTSASSTYLVLFRPFKVNKPCGRRALFSFLVATAAGSQGSDTKKSLLQEYLRRSRENKAKYDKERLDDYYNRNYKDYFEFVEGSLKGKSEDLLSESEKEIREWLQRNKK